MSFINKVKNFFYEDIEEDDEEFEAREAQKREEKLRKRLEKEKKKVQAEMEKRREIEPEVPVNKVQEANNDLSERELFKSEKTFNFPMDIDEDIFDVTRTIEVEEPKEESRKQIKEERNLYARPNKTVTPSTVTSTRNLLKEEVSTGPKRFHPSPVVSPVYGILDKNYTVDDVVDKNLSKTKEFSLEKKSVDFDTVRNRAYKELDDEIEKTLTGSKDIFYNLDEEDSNISSDEIDDYVETPYDKDENDFDMDDVKITYEGEESTNDLEEDLPKEKPKVEEEPEEDIDFATPDVEIVKKVAKRGRKAKEEVESEEPDEEKEDLFNLIDNMYNDEEDEEEEE